MVIALVLLFLSPSAYEYHYELEIDTIDSFIKTGCNLANVQVSVAYDGGAQALNSADISLQFQSLLAANGFSSSVVPVTAPTSTVHTPTTHTVHAPPTPHVNPVTPHASSSHSMEMGMEAMAGTVHEDMAPATMGMGMDDMDIAHQASAHAGDMGMKKGAFTSDLSVVIETATCPVDISALNSPANRNSLGRSLGVTVSSVTVTSSACVDCATVPDVTVLCPATRDVSFCLDIANTLMCMAQSCAVMESPDTDPTCQFDLSTIVGLTTYFTTICSPATV
eukprot:c1680_g1_i1.p1 GENE.c1680_g1_i1~~c1680_g1_i1.p1  ORF type:complete len:279 (+),score=58.55 c1680_g1_i1:55-891(+)